MTDSSSSYLPPFLSAVQARGLRLHHGRVSAPTGGDRRRQQLRKGQPDRLPRASEARLHLKGFPIKFFPGVQTPARWDSTCRRALDFSIHTFHTTRGRPSIPPQALAAMTATLDTGLDAGALDPAQSGVWVCVGSERMNTKNIPCARCFVPLKRSAMGSDGREGRTLHALACIIARAGS